MKGKIISLTVVILMIFGSIGATGLNNLTNKENIEVYEQFKQDDKIIEDFESDCANCEYEGYYFGLLGDPFVLFEPEKLVELSGDPPESWDWRNATYNGTTGNWVTSVKDQGECGSCASFASVACFESVYKISKSDPNIDVDFSEQFMVSCGKEWIGNKNCFTRMQGCQGATIFAVLEFIKKHGAINETCFSYTSGINGVVPPCSDKCENWKEQRIRAKDYKLVMGEIIEEDDDTVDYDPTNYKNALVKYGPLATPMFVYEDFIDYTGGIYGLNRSKPWKILGGHMVLIVGYRDDPSIDSGGYWICKNSWGTDWGENGYFRIKYDDFTKWFHKEYNDRALNIKNLRDLIEFFIWTYLVTKNPPTVGIGYTFSAFFTGLTMKKLEISTPIEKHSKDISFPVFHGWQPFLNFLQQYQNLFPILKILLFQR